MVFSLNRLNNSYLRQFFSTNRTLVIRTMQNLKKVHTRQCSITFVLQRPLLISDCFRKLITQQMPFTINKKDIHDSVSLIFMKKK